MKEKMKYLGGCITPMSKDQYNKLLEYAESSGIKLWGDARTIKFGGYAVIYNDMLGTSSGGTFKVISQHEFLSELGKLIVAEEPIMAGEYKAEFKNDGVQFGCTFVPKDVVEKVYKKLFNK